MLFFIICSSFLYFNNAIIFQSLQTKFWDHGSLNGHSRWWSSSALPWSCQLPWQALGSIRLHKVQEGRRHSRRVSFIKMINSDKYYCHSSMMVYCSLFYFLLGYCWHVMHLFVVMFVLRNYQVLLQFWIYLFSCCLNRMESRDSAPASRSRMQNGNIVDVSWSMIRQFEPLHWTL